MIDAKPMLKDAKDILTKANPEQVKWVLARLTCRTDGEAAKVAGVHFTTVSRWDNKHDLDRAVNLLLRKPVAAALMLLQDAAVEAATVITDSLNDKRNKLKAADSVLDRVGLRGKQEVEIGGKDGEPIKVKTYLTVSPDDWPEPN